MYETINHDNVYSLGSIPRNCDSAEHNRSDAVVSRFHNLAYHRLRDRADAGQRLAAKLAVYANRNDVLVLGLPRGGVPVAYEIARALQAPLDIFLVRKLGVPGHEELAMGAIATGGVRVLNEDIVKDLAIPLSTIDEVVKREQQELDRRARVYRGDRPLPDAAGKTVILVDDGIATGATLRAAIAALRTQHPAQIVVAVGVAPLETSYILVDEVDELVCVFQPTPFWGVGLWFDQFEATSDEEVRLLLAQARNAEQANPDDVIEK